MIKAKSFKKCFNNSKFESSWGVRKRMYKNPGKAILRPVYLNVFYSFALIAL